ncbi:MAG: hypothetical protein QXP29_02740 [Candidatus Nezhaarchaeales archaeon]
MRKSMSSLEEEHYSKQDVREEIAKFAKDRWVGVHCLKRDGKGNRIMVRHVDGKPITIGSPHDLYLLKQRLRDKGLRTIYATAAVYRKITSRGDVASLSNIISYTPTWDVDNDFENWRSTIKACIEIVEFLREEGVSKSVYIKWSGNGAHVHLHEKSLSSRALRGKSPLDLAYAIVEYVKIKVEPRIQEIALSDGCNIKVENKIDRQRMFTCPLSLHRDHDKVCICMKPNQLHHFSPSWIDPQGYIHNKEWTLYEEEEADALAEKALNVIGGFPVRRSRTRKYPKLDEAIVKWMSFFK